jgi:excisionase family DNA binding protein
MARSPVMLISTAEAARRLGVSRERVRQMLEQGTLAGF